VLADLEVACSVACSVTATMCSSCNRRRWQSHRV